MKLSKSSFFLIVLGIYFLSSCSNNDSEVVKNYTKDIVVNDSIITVNNSGCLIKEFLIKAIQHGDALIINGEFGNNIVHNNNELSNDWKILNEILKENREKKIKLTLNDVVDIPDNAFFESTSLISVSLPKVKTIGENTFRKCINLESVSLPNITAMGDRAFVDCTSLKSLFMPNVEKMGNDVFCGASTNNCDLIINPLQLTNIQTNVWKSINK